MSVQRLAKISSECPIQPDMPGPGPYFSCLVDMRSVDRFPFDFALYFSTDHVFGEGGVWLYVGNGPVSDLSTWQSYDGALATGAFDHLETKPAANPIYVESTQGEGHTETPFANVINGRVYLTYHKDRLYGQATLLALSNDGVNFERLNGCGDSVVLLNPTHSSNPFAHTGYFRWGPNPFTALEAKYVGYSLYEGGDAFSSAQWVSDDAIDWKLRSVFPGEEGVGIDDPERILIWHEIDPASIEAVGDGTYTAFCNGGNRASGAASRVRELYRVYLNEDGTEYVRPAEKILTVGAPGELDAEELASLTSLKIGERREFLYVGACEQAQRNCILSAIEA